MITLQGLPGESQPLTPISSTTPDHGDARTPQSVRSLDSEPFVPVPVKSTKGRKRKLERKGSNGNVTQMGLDSGVGHQTVENHSHSHPSNCSKRQIIVPNEISDGGKPVVANGGMESGMSNGISATSVHVDNMSNASPHNSSIETDNSGDSTRWRKSSHQHWSASVSFLLKFCRILLCIVAFLL